MRLIGERSTRGRRLALAAAFAPDSEQAQFYGDFPYRVDGERVLPDDAAYSRWTAHLPAARLDREAAGLKTPHGFRIQYGDHDTLRHIVASVPAFDSARGSARGGETHIVVVGGGFGGVLGGMRAKP